MKRPHWFADDDIPANILRHLSAKTLHHFKFVSKQWHTLISDRSFISSQLKKTEPLSGFFFQETFQWIDIDGVDSVSYIPVGASNVKVCHTALLFLPERVAILSSNNGLLCCRSCFSNSEPTVYVCNPLNKQWTSLQGPIHLRNSSISLAFDPFQDPIDCSTDFKLVAVSSTEAAGEHQFSFDIYSSKTASWIRLKECCQSNHSLYKSKGIYVEGVLYWLMDGYQILMLDTQNELPWLFMAPLPASQFSSIPEMCIGESHGKLCYAIISEHGLQLWVLEDYFTSLWELRISTSLDKLEMENSNVLYKISGKVASRVCKDDLAWMDPLAFKDGTLLLRVSAIIYSYQFHNKSMGKLCDASTLGPKSMYSPTVIPYTMTLVPLHHA